MVLEAYPLSRHITMTRRSSVLRAKLIISDAMFSWTLRNMAAFKYVE
jgi:hypothetical protein